MSNKNIIINPDGSYSSPSNDAIDASIWDGYDYSSGKSKQKSKLLSNLASKAKTSALDLLDVTVNGKKKYAISFLNSATVDTTDEEKRGQWTELGSGASSKFKSIWNTDYGDTMTSKAVTAGKNVLSTIGTAAKTAIDSVGLAASQGLNKVIKEGANVAANVESFISDQFDKNLGYSEELASTINNITDTLGKNSVFFSTIAKGIQIFSDGALTVYKNGVDETSFGRMMESSWSKGGASSFASLINKEIVFAKSTPFDSGDNMNNLYGNMLLGVPPIFTNIVDPKNRAISETFIRDAKFLSLTPGFPKYNGSNMLLRQNDDQYHQTTSGKSMLEYLLKNGIENIQNSDSGTIKYDRRYYTFEKNYDEYYAYLETMLNTLWIKMGLGTTGENIPYSMFTFFDEPTKTSAKLKSQYNSSIGFYVNPAGALVENISNSSTDYGSDYSGEVNAASDTYQHINYLTGMGTGGSARTALAMTAKGLGLVNNIKTWISDVASNTINAVQNRVPPLIAQIANVAGAVAEDARHFTTEVDPGAQLQAFAVTNGMKIVYPELWSNSTFSKSVSINFEFISPYGDPMSIFQYVIAPFCALLTFAMPRQAADNGFVSPFFVRADIPGLFTSDLALISDFSWTRGGNNDLWTKDGLPRAISGSFTLQDLYPYLAMTKRISFLSANPNYTIFLDNLAGLHSINATEDTSALNEHWKVMLNRVSTNEISGLYNKYSQNHEKTHTDYANSSYSSRIGRTKTTWMRGLS